MMRIPLQHSEKATVRRTACHSATVSTRNVAPADLDQPTWSAQVADLIGVPGNRGTSSDCARKIRFPCSTETESLCCNHSTLDVGQCGTSVARGPCRASLLAEVP
jgi:hypothetical protein